jgi:predicted anti-sigma-YlaC factor YlaD
MTCQNHEIKLMLSDYVLGIVSVSEKERVAKHLAGCDDCRAVVRNERALAQEVRQTMAALPMLPSARLRALMPAPPRRLSLQTALWRPAAVVALLAVLFLGSLLINQAGGAYSLPTAPATAVAATATQVPTTKLTPARTHEVRGLTGADVTLVAMPVAAVVPQSTPERPARLP